MLVVARVGVATLAAQTVTRPYPAVFGGAGTAAPAKGPTLDLAVDAADAYDDNLQADVANAPNPSVVQASGFYTVLAPSAVFETHSGKFHLVATGSSNVRYYGDLEKVLVTGHSAAVGLNAELNRKTQVFVNQAVSYSPAYLHGLFASVAPPAAGAPIEPASDYTVDDGRSMAYATTANVTHTINPKIDLSADGAYRRTDFTGNTPGYSNLRGYDVGGAMRYLMTRNLKFRLGYTYHYTEYTPEYHPEENDVGIGFEYSRALSALRRTTFAFNLSPSIATGVSSPTELPEGDRQYRIGGDFSVIHQLTRTWTVRGSLRRGLAYIENVPRPVMTNAASVDAQGFLNRRTDLTVSAGYTSGELALSGTPPPFSTYTGVARLRFAFARNLAAFGEYFYYYYDFNQDFPLPPGVAPTLTRHGARVGLTLWVPLGRR